MTHGFPEWAYLADETGRHWLRLADGSKQPVDGQDVRPPGKAVYAIDTRDLISIPQWVSSKDEEIISQVISVETERLGLQATEGPGKISDWKTVELNGSRTLVQSVSIPWAFPDLDDLETEFTDFVPRYSLFSPPKNSVVLWKERDLWAAGFSRGESWAHVQTLGQLEHPEALASELQLTLLELSAKGVIDQMDQVVIWGPYDLPLHRALQEGTGLDVHFDESPTPNPSQASDWDFEPHSVTQSKIEATQRSKGILYASIVILVLALIVAGAIAHLWLLNQSNQSLNRRIEANRASADVIESTMERWRAFEPAIDPKRSPIEIFHQISVLLPEKGFRLTQFEIQNNQIVTILGEGASMANALTIKGAIENAAELSDYEWQIPPPTLKGGLIELRATGTYRFSQNETQ